MRILADENMPRRVVSLLRASGHDVEWARESHRGTPDPGLLELSTRKERTLITYDSDFGVLVNRDNMPAPYGVVFFRIHSDVPEEVQEDFIVRTTTVRDSWPPGVWTIQIRHQPDNTR